MMRRIFTGAGGRRRAYTVLAVLTTVAGVIAIAVAVAGQQSAPVPPPSAAGTIGSMSSSADGSSGAGESASPRGSVSPASPPSESATGAQTDGSGEGSGDGTGDGSGDGPAAGTQQHGDEDDSLILGPSRPVSISIPAIDLHSEVFRIGKNPDGTLAVPQPGPRLNKTAWFKDSPTPGELGPAIILGHVDTVNGPSVFFRLGDLRPGDKIKVTRADGRTAVFTIQGLKSFPKDNFPTELVYGGSLDTSSLRLITCSNFDEGLGTHIGNLVVFSELTKVTGGHDRAA